MVDVENTCVFTCACILVIGMVSGVYISIMRLQNPNISDQECDNYTLGLEYRNDNDYIGLVFAACPSEAVFEGFQEAARTWSQVINENRVTPSTSSLSGFSATSVCNFLLNNVRFDGGSVFDHLVIVVDIDFIDGVGGTLGQAGPCLIDNADKFPIVSGMIFDDADLRQFAAGSNFQTLLVHEMAHALGFGISWQDNNLIEDPIFSGFFTKPSNIPKYIGESAVEKYNELSVNENSFVPIEDGRVNGEFSTFRPDQDKNSGRGSIDSHWKKEVFGDETMIFSIRKNGNPYPFSKVTIAAIEDLGYSVDYQVADDFSLKQDGATITSLRGIPDEDGEEYILTNDVPNIRPIRLKDLTEA